MSRRRSAALAAAGAAAAAAVILLAVTGVLGGGGTIGGHHAPGRASAVAPGDGPAMPARGAYFGAWVKPPAYTQQGYLSAVTGLQRQIGRRLDIVHVYLQRWDTFPTRSERAFLHQGSTLLVSWALSDTRAIESGSYNGLIRQRARAIRAIGKPIFLEWRWEMDRPNLRAQVGSPADFIAAWKHIRAIFSQEHADNVAWVWCPTARGFAGGYASAYYPGDAQVDWICADAYPGRGPYRSFADIVQPFLDWASHHPKPIMIGEYGVPHSYGPLRRAQWLRDAARTVTSHQQIKALVYFDSDGAGSVPETRFSLDATALEAFRGIADDRYFNPRGLPVARH